MAASSCRWLLLVYLVFQWLPLLWMAALDSWWFAITIPDCSLLGVPTLFRWSLLFAVGACPRLQIAANDCVLLKMNNLDYQWLPVAANGYWWLFLADDSYPMTADGCPWLLLAALNWANKLQCSDFTFLLNSHNHRMRRTNYTILLFFSLLLLYSLEGLLSKWF
jgi:hypothetical protein